MWWNIAEQRPAQCIITTVCTGHTCTPDMIIGRTGVCVGCKLNVGAHPLGDISALLVGARDDKIYNESLTFLYPLRQ